MTLRSHTRPHHAGLASPAMAAPIGVWIPVFTGMTAVRIRERRCDGQRLDPRFRGDDGLCAAMTGVRGDDGLCAEMMGVRGDDVFCRQRRCAAAWTGSHTKRYRTRSYPKTGSCWCRISPEWRFPTGFTHVGWSHWVLETSFRIGSTVLARAYVPRRKIA